MEQPLMGSLLSTLAEGTENPKWPCTCTEMLSLKSTNITSASSQFLGQNWLAWCPQPLQARNHAPAMLSEQWRAGTFA